MDFGADATIRSIEFATELSPATRTAVTDVLHRLRLEELTGDLTVSRLVGGASNENFIVATGSCAFVLRVAATMVERFGQDRAMGLEAHRRAHQVGVAPAIIGAVLPEGHCVTPFLDGRTMDTAMLNEPGVLDECVRSLTRAHHAAPFDGSWSIFEDTRRYMRIAAEEGLVLPDDISVMQAAMDRVEALFDDAGVPPRLCHNDLQVQNFIISPQRAWLLDWEYAGMSNPYLDLAMLIRYPQLSEDQTSAALKLYFGEERACDHARIALMYFAAALREAAWSVVAEPVLGVTGFDYRGWATLFFDRLRTEMQSDEFERALAGGAGRQDDDEVVFERARKLAQG